MCSRGPYSGPRVSHCLTDYLRAVGKPQWQAGPVPMVQAEHVGWLLAQVGSDSGLRPQG